MNVQQLLLATLISITIVLLALRRGSLSHSGGWAAFVVGTLILGLGGWWWGTLLIAFFISSTLFSHYRADKKRATAEKFEKGHQRDGMQVLANGGLGALLAIAFATSPNPLWFLAYVGVMATVTADTWATELGTLSQHTPRLITTGQAVSRGTSGGITVYGTLISLVGGLFIGAIAGLSLSAEWWRLLLIGGVSGLIGSLTDSLLGATVQRIYYDPAGKRETEKYQVDGQPLQQIRGWWWMNNDMVNLVASAIGGLVAVGLGVW